MNKQKYNAICQNLLLHYVRVEFADGGNLVGYLMARDNDPDQAEKGNFSINGWTNGSFDRCEQVAISAAKVKSIERRD